MSDVSDSTVIEGGELTVELGGRTYVWKEPVRRQLRKMVRGLIEIDAMRAGRDDNDPRLMLDLVDAILDFFYANHTGMAEDLAHLDNCDEEEIADAFKEVAAFLQAPFEKLKKRTEDKATSTPKPAYTKS